MQELALRSDERRDLLQAAARQRELAEVDEADLGALAETEYRLRQQGRHIDDWARVHGLSAARWLAAERERLVRRSLEAAGRPREPAASSERERRPQTPAAERGRST